MPGATGTATEPGESPTMSTATVTRIASLRLPLEANYSGTNVRRIAAAHAFVAETWETARDLLAVRGADRDSFTFPEHHDAGEWRIFGDHPTDGRLFVSVFPPLDALAAALADGIPARNLAGDPLVVTTCCGGVVYDSHRDRLCSDHRTR